MRSTLSTVKHSFGRTASRFCAPLMFRKHASSGSNVIVGTAIARQNAPTAKITALLLPLTSTRQSWHAMCSVSSSRMIRSVSYTSTGM